MDRLTEAVARLDQLAARVGMAYEPPLIRPDRLTDIVDRLDDLATKAGQPWEPPTEDPEPGEPGPITNVPTQPSAMIWDGEGGAHALAYARPGALVTVGRDNFASPTAKKLAAGGATVVIYLDPVIDNPWGRYHSLLLTDQPGEGFPGAVPRWPGSPKANEWGWVNDLRAVAGSVLHAKLPRVLDLALRENPHLGGVLLDDVGSRSWFPGFDWGRWSQADRQAWRTGMLHIVAAARAVCSQHGVGLWVNGTWQAGNGGGYPDPNQHGHSMIDGAVVENHGISEMGYWREYCSSKQWATDSPITGGKPFHWAWNINNWDARNAYIAQGFVSHALAQKDRDTPDEPWDAAAFHPTGLPSRTRSP